MTNTNRTYWLIFLALLTRLPAGAQVKEKEVISQVWVAYLNQTRISDKWGVWLDLHLRTKEDLVSGLSQGIFRAGITYYLHDQLKLTAGYAYVNHFPADNHGNISRPEHRPWQQVQWHTNFPKLRLMQWLRLEERWRRNVLNANELAGGYAFNFRFRYNILAMFPLSAKRFEKGTVSLVLNDELHINAGKQIKYNYFDQNRFFAGLNFHLSKTTSLQAGYMYFYQQLASGYQYRHIHVPRIFFFQNLDWR
ncbi:MAG: DUF2490 domain-containing protein [Chitinophagaceae bacterium]|nr:DUF2490 domain-containing protein [Chitinophagaceae bacterium]